MTHIFDEVELFNVAKAVEKFNKYQSGNLIRNIVENMRYLAITTLHAGEPSSYLSTAGFVLTAYKVHGDDVTIHIKASVAASLFADLPMPEVEEKEEEA